MSKIYAIMYDLKSKSHNYSCLYNQLISTNWCHYIQSAWLIETDETVEQIWNRIKPTMGEKDFVLIIEVNKNYQGQLPTEAWNWINEHSRTETILQETSYEEDSSSGSSSRGASYIEDNSSDSRETT